MLTYTCVSYIEAIDILYSCQIFDFQDMNTLFWFPSTILPKRLDAIRSLRLTVDRYTPKQLYAGYSELNLYHPTHPWQIIANLPQLKDLVITFNTPQETFTEQKKLVLLHPLMDIRQPENFELRVPWSEADQPALSDNHTFRLVFLPSDNVST